MPTQKQIEAGAEGYERVYHLMDRTITRLRAEKAELREALEDLLYLKRGCFERAEIILAKTNKAGAWQPIETAPKDGTDIWLGRFGAHNERLIGFWYKPHKHWKDYYSSGELCFTPTHWRPLQTAPTAADADPKSQKSW